MHERERVSGFWGVAGGEVRCRESKGEHLAFNVQANPKVWASTQLLESYIIHFAL
jgi:hypothetical protein